MPVSFFCFESFTGNNINNNENIDPRVRAWREVRWIISLLSPGTAGNEISAGLNSIISTTTRGPNYDLRHLSKVDSRISQIATEVLTTNKSTNLFG